MVGPVSIGTTPSAAASGLAVQPGPAPAGSESADAPRDPPGDVGTHSPNVLLRGRAFVPVPLNQLRPGDRARMHPEGLKCESCDLLNAMGLTDRCELRVCKVGEPCIVQINETRVGISSRLAREIMVTPLLAAGPADAPAPSE